jgi:carbonic anhydrase/acetyltransferase-like protein (isoleucine patch superfamily)
MISPQAHVVPFRGVHPILDETVFVAPGVVVVGDVIVGERSSIWYQTVIRGDVNFIRIGREVNLQDGSVIHVTTDTHPAKIGDGVSIGHAAVVHGATLEDGCLIGIGARVLDGVRIGAGAIIGAGSLVAPGTEIPPRVLAYGAPARVHRALSAEELELNRKIAEDYLELARLHARELGLLPHEGRS